MNITPNVSLADHSTMALGGPAAYLTEVTNRMEVLEALSWAQTQNIPAVMIGSGSNIIWQDAGFPGLVLVNKIMGYEVFEEDETNVYLTLGSGESWDSVVARSVKAGLTGIEALSLIPGTVGATPIQNVGAYGQEIAQTLTTIVAFDTKEHDFVTLAGSDCSFSYRSSRFKTADRRRFYITSTTLHLQRGKPLPPFYGSVQRYFDEHDVRDYTPAALRQAVIAIRTSKLPDPAVVHNTGSFFANPIVTDAVFIDLQTRYENLPHWSAGEGKIKLSAAWLVDQAGFNNYRDPDTGMATWPTQSLVLVNENAQSTTDLLKFKQKIVQTVQAKFNLTLQQEPELL